MIAEEYDCGGLLKLGYQQFDSSLIAASDHICPSVHDTAVLTMSLTTLPMLPLEEIASYLNFSSLVSLAASTASLIEEQNLMHYFDVEVKTRSLLAVRMVWRGSSAPTSHP